MDNREEVLKYVIKESLKKPLDIFELNDGTIVVKGMVFENRDAFDEIHNKAKRNIKRKAFLKRFLFWK